MVPQQTAQWQSQFMDGVKHFYKLSQKGFKLRIY